MTKNKMVELLGLITGHEDNELTASQLEGQLFEEVENLMQKVTTTEEVPEGYIRIKAEEVAELKAKLEELSKENERLKSLLPANPQDQLVKVLSINRESPLWAHMEVKATPNGWFCQFEREYYRANNDACYGLFAKIISRATRKGHFAKVQGGGLVVHSFRGEPQNN